MSPDLAFALSLADDADAISMARFRAADLQVETKLDLTPVSEADRLVESTLGGGSSASARASPCSARRRAATTRTG